MAKKVDINQKEIVAALRKIGATVQTLHEVGKGCPDLLVGFKGVNLLMEIKNPEYSGKLTEREAEWHDAWKGEVWIVETVDEALLFMIALT